MPPPRRKPRSPSRRLDPTVPSPAAATVRQLIVARLRSEEVGFDALRRAFGLNAKALGDALEHVHRSLRGTPERLVVVPARCRQCGFGFRDRQRMTPPSRCPLCRSAPVDEPAFRIRGPSGQA